MNRSTFNSSGFTLIELIVAFSIIAILAVVGISSFVDYSRSQAIVADRQKLISVLNTAKANSSSQVKKNYCQNASNQVLYGYSVTLDIANRTYTFNIECITTSATPTISRPFPIVYNLTNNIDFDASNTSVVKILYPLFTGKTILYSDIIGSGTVLLTPGKIVLSAYNKTKTSTITIDQAGIIK